MTAFWRKEPLNQQEIALFRAVTKAHIASTFRDNPSSVLVKVVADSAGDYTKAMIAALSSLGGKHAPIEQIVELLSAKYPLNLAEIALDRGEKVPGFGSSFIQGGVDPDWQGVDSLLRESHQELWDKIWSVTKFLHGRGKKIYPNPGCYTAATAIALALPPKLAPWLLIRSRLDAWTQIFAESCG